MTPLGIEPATFRLVAQCLTQLRQPVPPSIIRLVIMEENIVRGEMGDGNKNLCDISVEKLTDRAVGVVNTKMHLPEMEPE